MFDFQKWSKELSVSEDTKELLKELIKRKEKEQQLKFRLILLSIINAIIIIVILFWMFRMNAAADFNVFNIIEYIGSSRASLVFILLAVSLFIYSSSVSKEHKKHKDKYDSLREEAARRLSASWKINEDSKLKDAISDKLKTEKDINIRYNK